MRVRNNKRGVLTAATMGIEVAPTLRLNNLSRSIKLLAGAS